MGNQAQKIPLQKEAFILTNEHFKIIPHGAGKQAVLSFQISKGAIQMFVQSRFWIHQEKEVAVAANLNARYKQ